MLSLARLRGRYLAPVTMIRLVPISVVLLGGIALTTWTSGLLSRHRDLVVHTRAGGGILHHAEVAEFQDSIAVVFADIECLLSRRSCTSMPN